MLSLATSSSIPSSSSSSTPSSSSDSPTPTAIFLTSSPASYSSSSVSALQEGVIRPSARFKRSRILIIVLSVVAGCIFLLLLLFVILRRRRRYRFHDRPEDDFQPDSVGRRDLSEKPERYQGSITDEPVVRPRRFSSISKRLWQDPPKRPLTPSWGPLPTFPDSASLMTVGSHERQLTPRFEIVSRDGLLGDNGSGHGARPWNLQRGYSDPMLNRPTGRAIEIAPIIIHRPSEGETEAEQEINPEEEAEEEDKGNEDVAQREVGEEEGFNRKSVEKSSTGSTSSSVLGYYSRSLRAPHQSTSEFCEPSSSSHSFDTGTKSSSTSQPVLDHYQAEPLNDHPNQWTTPATSLLAPPPKPPKSLYRLTPALKTQMSLTTDSRQNSGFTLDGSNPFTD
ncbi:Glycophorin [Phaffia rhodozyma]|uniref:Glycophorin n=1 Tax=Phaffia rhodozyma TaxID=264483 RepID=A0A0F7ST17_PHARH|nr:Glycophorin [Phaffia rhodozyma]